MAKWKPVEVNCFLSNQKTTTPNKCKAMKKHVWMKKYLTNLKMLMVPQVKIYLLNNNDLALI